MKSDDILLSICIPTYNRVDILMDMLHRFVNDPDFDDEVEIVVSDNCSTDDTGMRVKELASSYKNVRYFCNETNVRDRNFYLALSRGQGRYLKLLNDYIAFKPGGLREMKSFIRKYAEQDVNLLFYARLRSPHKKKKEVWFDTVDAFVHDINNKVTWIGNYGIMRKYFAELHEDEALWKTQLAQTEWTLYEASLRKTVVVNCSFFETLDVPGKKMDYLFYMPHVVHYYDIFQSYVDRGLISPKTIAHDKYRLLSHFVGSRIVQFLYLEKEVSFDKKKAHEVLNNYFGDIPYYRYLKVKGCVLCALQRAGVLAVLKSFRRNLKAILKAKS